MGEISTADLPTDFVEGNSSTHCQLADHPVTRLQNSSCDNNIWHDLLVKSRQEERLECKYKINYY